MTERTVLPKREMQWAITRLAHEILEKNRGAEDLAVVGVRTRGAHLAARLVEEIAKIAGGEVPLGIVDITLYRDDLQAIGPQPVIRGTDIPFDVEEKVIVLVDDVLYTGRTVRAAIDEIIDFGRPKRIWLTVLVDRQGHRELPISPDFVGEAVVTTENEQVVVHVSEEDGEDAVKVREKKT
ncbi:MAG: bifunctional pyr operon transcriptional regulator/uracil phosphoribosyltransferase PyrR [Candidatus Eisenbacteria bacterium]|nr:bifunctional pyr operon transcriptional regulator/uracil phosphoribosyltransferase PyrR [Candidatus Eisenbacteria bacterium]